MVKVERELNSEKVIKAKEILEQEKIKITEIIINQKL